MSTRVFGHISLVLVFLAAAWTILGPSQFGGVMSLAVTRGSSMEPGFHAGDLVLVRESARIDTGDIILYRSTTTGQDVLHRVIGRSGDAYLTKGDSNSWVDLDRPTIDDIRGVHVGSLAGAGAWIEPLRSPLGTAGSAGLALALIGMSLTPARVRPMAGKRRGRSVAPRLGTRLLEFSVSGNADALIGMASGILAVGALLAAWSFNQPTSDTSTASVTYAHSANWSYQAAKVSERNTGMGGAYQPENPFVSGYVTTGQPIFPSLTPVTSNTLQYQLIAPELQDVRGRIRMYAVLREDSTGWSQEYPLTEWEDFIGRGTSIIGETDLAKAMWDMEDLQRATGLSGGIFRAVLAAEVELQATDAGGNAVEDRYHTFVMYRLDVPRVVRVEQAAGAVDADTLARGIDPVGHLFAQTETRARTYPVRDERRVDILGGSVTIQTLRVSAGGLAVAGLALFGTIVFLRSRARRLGEWFMIRARYGPRFTFAQTAPVDPHARDYVEVVELDDLLALAEGWMLPLICVEAGDQVELYVLDLPNAIYRHRLSRVTSEERFQAYAPSA